MGAAHDGYMVAAATVALAMTASACGGEPPTAIESAQSTAVGSAKQDGQESRAKGYPSKINEAVRVARRALMIELGWKPSDDIRMSTACAASPGAPCKWNARIVTFDAYKTYEGLDRHHVYLQFVSGRWKLKEILPVP